MKISLSYTITVSILLVIFAIKNADSVVPLKTPIDEGVVYTKVFEVTGYCLCEKCCGRWSRVYPRRTASGHLIQPGDKFVAAPKSIKFGTRMIIPGYNGGQAVTVQDRGGAIKEGKKGQPDKLDLFFDSHQAAKEWGRKQVKVKVYVE